MQGRGGCEPVCPGAGGEGTAPPECRAGLGQGEEGHFRQADEEVTGRSSSSLAGCRPGSRAAPGLSVRVLAELSKGFLKCVSGMRRLIFGESDKCAGDGERTPPVLGRELCR